MNRNNQVYQINGRITVERLTDGMVVGSLASGRLFHLNGTAAEIYDSLDGEASVGSIISRLARRYEQPPEAIAPQVESFIQQLLAADVIEEKVP